MKIWVVIDLMCLLHPLTHQHKHKPYLSEYWDRLLRGWFNKISQPILWLPELVGEADLIQPILAVDLKLQDRYWRHDILPTYKSGRKTHSDLLTKVKEQTLAYAQMMGLPVLASPGFEADDWAGEVIRSLGKDDRVFLLTVDSDWGQLVSDRVIWLDTYCATRRSHPDQQSLVLDVPLLVKRINAYPTNAGDPITTPRDIVSLKWKLGDWESDRIPGGCVPEFRGIIDLVRPSRYPTPISLPELIQQPKLFTGVPDLPMYMLGLPSYSGYTVDLESMRVIDGTK